MKSDFKISGILRDGQKTTVNAVFYKGEITTENEYRGVILEPITRYRRQDVLDRKAFVLLGDVKDEEVLKYMKNELKKYKNFDPIPEQQ